MMFTRDLTHRSIKLGILTTLLLLSSCSIRTVIVRSDTLPVSNNANHCARINWPEDIESPRLDVGAYEEMLKTDRVKATKMLTEYIKELRGAIKEHRDAMSIVRAQYNQHCVQ